MEQVRIVNASPEYFESHTRTINSVAAERKYLSANGGFTLASTRSFYNACKEAGYPQFYIINEKNEAVGWCDIVERPNMPDGVGFIGIGLLPEYRERGIGSYVMQYAMDAAKKAGFHEIRLDCRVDNKRAIHVYQKLGFKSIAYKKHGLKVDNEKFDLVCMKLSLK